MYDCHCLFNSDYPFTLFFNSQQSNFELASRFRFPDFQVSSLFFLKRTTVQSSFDWKS